MTFLTPTRARATPIRADVENMRLNLHFLHFVPQ